MTCVTTKSGHLPIEHWIGLLKSGSMAKIIKALKSGQPIHPPVPVSLSLKGGRLSPLTFVYGWDWERKRKTCMEALDLLLKAGADPNLPDHLGRRPLHLALWLGPIYGIENDEIKILLDAGADPALTSATGPNMVDMSAFDVCMLQVGMTGRGRELLELLLQHDPGAVTRCERPPLVTLSWNCGTLDDQQIRELCHLLLEAGSDPDVRGHRNHRTLEDISKRMGGFIDEWQARKERDRMHSNTPTALGSSSGAPRL